MEEQYTQLMLDLGEDSPDQSKTRTPNKKCKHEVVLKSFKKDFVTYCRVCGKILSISHKKTRKKGN